MRKKSFLFWEQCFSQAPYFISVGPSERILLPSRRRGRERTVRGNGVGSFSECSGSFLCRAGTAHGERLERIPGESGSRFR